MYSPDKNKCEDCYTMRRAGFKRPCYTHELRDALVDSWALLVEAGVLMQDGDPITKEKINWSKAKEKLGKIVSNLL